jgi:hypothetical protein
LLKSFFAPNPSIKVGKGISTVGKSDLKARNVALINKSDIGFPNLG